MESAICDREGYKGTFRQLLKSKLPSKITLRDVLENVTQIIPIRLDDKNEKSLFKIREVPMSTFYVMTHPSPQGAHAGWTYCAIPDCECSLPKVCLNIYCLCDRPNVCARSDCYCDLPKVCTSPFCECDRPKVITESYGSPIKLLPAGVEKEYLLVEVP